MNDAMKDDPKPTNIARVLDFPGFYESCLTMALDDAERMEVENIAENHPEPADESAIYDAFYQHSNYSKGFDAIARASVDWLNHVLEGTGIELAFDSMESPREYNFTTDALFVTINDPVKLYADTNTASLNAVIKERFTSGPGFHSFYSNDPDAWRAKPLDEWDHNELGALLTAYLRQQAEEKDLDQHDMLEWMQEDFYSAVSDQVDWDALHATLGIKE